MSGGTRNEYRIYCNGALEGKQLLFQPDDILIFRAEKTSSLPKDILGSNDVPEAAVEEANQEMLKEIKKNSEKYGITDDVVAILITRPDLASGKDILNSLEYYHFRTGHSINFYLPGYGAYWTEEEYPDGKVVTEIAGVKWSFSNQRFVEFIEDMEKYSKWRYSGESDLIFAEVKNGRLSYERAMEFHLDNMLRDKAIISVNQFFEKIVRIGQEGRSMNQIGNKLGIDKGKQVVFDALLEKMPMYVEAIGAIDAEAFMERIDVPVFSNNDNQKMLVAIKECISLAKGCEPTNEEVWKFCKAFILLLFDMDCAESVNRALSASLIKCNSPENPILVWSRLG